MIKETIKEMINQIINTCKFWVKEGEDGLLRFVDPIDGQEISAHYGASHVAVAFIMYGEYSGDNDLSKIGYELLSSIIKRWGKNVKLPGFHNDFNNFALCVIWDYFNKNKVQNTYCDKIKELVLGTPDSNNPTVNWFPMRWYVNFFRYQWTGKTEYKKACDKCRADIKTATYSDGFIDDRLPVGLSFNLQYNIATVAVMQFLRNVEEKIDISCELGALLNVVAPDGDINYIGRGTNQIFAWGLWIYLLATAGKETELELALNYLKDKVPLMLQNNNIMLNEWSGKEKFMWWDYHYCSVYTAHFLFWLIMADKQMKQYPVEEKKLSFGASGVRVYRGASYFVVTFTGRKEYLSEKGPCIVLLWTKREGILIKGTFGPWQGAFGRKYSPIDVTLRNYCGLMEVRQNKDYSTNRWFRKILHKLEYEISETIIPVFTDIQVINKNNSLEIVWTYTGNKKLMFSCSSYKMADFKLYTEFGKEPLLYLMKIRNQYSWLDLLQSQRRKANIWTLRIPL